MKLFEDGKIDIDQKLSYYLPELKGSNKENMIIREVLAHNAKLKPWIPFFLETLDRESLYDSIFSENQNVEFPIRVARNFYINKSYWCMAKFLFIYKAFHDQFTAQLVVR